MMQEELLYSLFKYYRSVTDSLMFNETYINYFCYSRKQLRFIYYQSLKDEISSTTKKNIRVML